MHSLRTFRFALVLIAAAGAMLACGPIDFFARMLPRSVPAAPPAPAILPAASQAPVPPATAALAPAGPVSAGGLPVVTSFVAKFVQAAKSTSYYAQANSPDVSHLEFDWTNSNHCGTFTQVDNIATWYHPDGPGGVDWQEDPFCPKEDVHPGAITVVITATNGKKITCVYETSGPGTLDVSKYCN